MTRAERASLRRWDREVEEAIALTQPPRRTQRYATTLAVVALVVGVLGSVAMLGLMLWGLWWLLSHPLPLVLVMLAVAGWSVWVER